MIILPLFFYSAERMYTSSKILHWSFGIFVFLINAYFSTRILSFIVSLKSDIPFSNARDILQSTYEVVATKHSGAEKDIVGN